MTVDGLMSEQQVFLELELNAKVDNGATGNSDNTA